MRITCIFFFWLSAVLLVASPQATHIPLHWQTLLKNLSCSNCTKTTWATNFNEILMCEHPWKRKIIWAQINGWKIHGIHAVLENTSLFSSTSTAHTLKKNPENYHHWLVRNHTYHKWDKTTIQKQHCKVILDKTKIS